MARKKSPARGTNQLTLDAPAEVNAPSRTLVEEVEAAFLEYSMSVIVSRALPDVRDGLKPVHRRILWAMHDANLRPDRPFVKCARVVGDVMANYHPHGDSAIYDALVRMGQPFSLTAPLVDKHGNFGSPADPPAASRYTECRLSQLAMELLAAIDEGTVDQEPNYDGSRSQPVVLPARFPNLLVNGAQGIAVGMATNIPPHNLAEVCNAALKLIDKPDATLSELMRIVKGPDFPTGGFIMGDDGIKDAFRTGRGTVRVRARHEIEAIRRGGQAIVLTEVPFQTSVDAIAGKLAELVESGKIDGVRDIRNESGQGKTRLVIELRNDANPQIVLNNLFKHTAAQSTFPVNMVALVDGVPRTINLQEALQAWLDHQVVVVTRRSQFRLEKAQARLHIVEGLIKALDMIDAVVKAIRASADRAAARDALMGKRFGFSEIQANHILDMALGRLTRLGRDELANEAKELAATVTELQRILAKREVLMGVIRSELTAIRDEHKAPRRAEIVSDDAGTIDVVALVEDEPYSVTVTARGYVRAQPERGRGRAVSTGERDAIAQVIETSALAGVLFFTNRGRAYRATVHELPKERLTAAQNLFQLGDGERVIAVLDARMRAEHPNLVFVTARGGVKRSALSEFADASGRKDGIVAMKLADDDHVVSVFPGWDDFELLLVTAAGQGIRFAEADVRPVGRSAGSMRGIKLKGDDRVVGGCAVAHEEIVVIATAAGYAKRTEVDEFPVQARGGSGLKAAKIDKARGALVTVAPAAEQIAFVTADAALVVESASVRAAARDGGGSKVAGVSGALQRVVAVAAPADTD
ncbi:MAG: gyrase subunit [Actinomycetota bacterium]|nr:gyrase subunit [Actinomycetota bacterium]